MLELNKCVHEFVMGDRSHPQSKQIYEKPEEIAKRLRKEGYVPKTNNVLADIEEEENETALCYHGERLAIEFALVSTSPGMSIRIVKNLRVCGDCHQTAKLISKVYEREIVVRDRSWFHHFNSCKDYWKKRIKTSYHRQTQGSTRSHVDQCRDLRAGVIYTNFLCDRIFVLRVRTAGCSIDLFERSREGRTRNSLS